MRQYFSDPLIVSKFHNETHDPKGQENKIYTIVKGRETFYRRHTVPVTSCSEVKYVLLLHVLAVNALVRLSKRYKLDLKLIERQFLSVNKI